MNNIDNNCLLTTTVSAIHVIINSDHKMVAAVTCTDVTLFITFESGCRDSRHGQLDKSFCNYLRWMFSFPMRPIFSYRTKWRKLFCIKKTRFHFIVQQLLLPLTCQIHVIEMLLYVCKR